MADKCEARIMRIEKRCPIMNRVVTKHPILDARCSNDEQTKARDHDDGAPWILRDPGVQALVAEQWNRNMKPKWYWIRAQ